MSNVIEKLQEKVPNMRLKNIVQTGYINVAMTEFFAEYAKTTFFTEAKFNPFEDNPKVEVITDKPHYVAALTFGTVDVLALNGMKTYTDIRHSLSAWLVNVRRNGLIVVTGTDTEGIKEAIEDTLAQVDPECFDVQHYDNFTFIIPTE